MGNISRESCKCENVIRPSLSYPQFDLNINRGYLLFEVNTKYISSNVLKISVISRVLRTLEIADIFNTFNEIFLVFNEKK